MSVFKDLIPHRLLYEVNKHIDQNNLQDATSQLVSLLEAFPYFAPGYNVLGYLYANQFSDPRNAIPCYEKALETDPNYPPTYFNFIVTLNAVEQHGRVPEIAEKALQVKGVDPGKIYYGLGMSKELVREYAAAKMDYLKAIRHSVVDVEINEYRKAVQRCDLKLSIPAS